MNELKFLVSGSEAEPYEVIFLKDGSSLTAICSCMAGSHGNSCKHRIQILEGKPKGIVSENLSDAATVVEWLAGSDVEEALLELRRIEKSADKSKDELSLAKRKLARTMNT